MRDGRVRLDVDHVNEWMRTRGYTRTAFSRALGKSPAWWNTTIYNGGGWVPRKTADHMVKTFGFTDEELILESKPAPKVMMANRMARAVVDDANQSASASAVEQKNAVIAKSIEEYVTILLAIDKRLTNIERLLTNQNKDSEV